VAAGALGGASVTHAHATFKRILELQFRYTLVVVVLPVAIDRVLCNGLG
jgi:hypothetical protein